MKAKSELKNWTPENAPRLRSRKSGGVVLLTDDLAAREAASDAGVEVHGSIGVIAFGYGRGLLDRHEAASRMRALQRETSLFVTEAVVERGIRMLDEQ
jgi:predicted nucleic acid-binding protein